MTYPDVFETRNVVARVRHRCSTPDCEATIEPGDEYLRVKGLWEGSWSNFQFCKRHEQMLSKLEFPEDTPVDIAEHEVVSEGLAPGWSP